MLAMVIVFALFLVMGTLFAFGKGGFLIAGWNVMSPQERARYDEKKVYRSMSGLMFSLAGCVGLALLGEALGRQVLKTLGFVLAVPLVIFFVVRVNRAGKK
jgi:hypothetical protein